MTVNVSKPAINVREKLAELDKPTGIAGEAMLRAETPQEQFNLIGAGRRNLIINGAMQVAQRGTSFTNASDSGYTLDRWRPLIGSGAQQANISQVTDAPTAFEKSVKVEVTTANASPNSSDYYLLSYGGFEVQDISSLALGDAASKPITLSFWVKSNKAGTAFAELQYSTSVGTVEHSLPYTVNSVNTWEYKTLTFDAPTAFTPSTTTSNALGLILYFWLMAGSGLSSSPLANTWGNNANRVTGISNFCDAVGNTFNITGVQLEVGKVATPFEHRSYGEELALCQRYFFRLDPSTLLCFATNTTRVTGSFTFPTSMRAVPTRSGTNVTNMNIWYVTNIAGVYTFEVAPTTVDHSNVSYVYSSGTQFTSGTMHRPNGSFSIDYDAEL